MRRELPLAIPFTKVNSNIPIGMTICECTPQHSDLENPEHVLMQSVVPVQPARFCRRIHNSSKNNNLTIKMYETFLCVFISSIMMITISGVIYSVYRNLK